jgi:ureidoglycolate hydrolase
MQQLPEPEKLTPEAFAPFGIVLRREAGGDAFQDLHTDSESQGWRVALLDTSAGPLKRVHRHPNSEECFAPLFGDPCIAVASPEDPDSFRLFQLSEPVCIRRLVWHEIVSRQNSRVFIAENATISGEDHYLDPVEWNLAL